MIEIPLSNNPEQLFSITYLGVKYDLRVIFNSRTGIWSLNISSKGAPIVSGIPLTCGKDLFFQYNLPFKNAYVVNLENVKVDPTFEGLGQSSRLFILEDSELNG